MYVICCGGGGECPEYPKHTTANLTSPHLSAGYVNGLDREIGRLHNIFDLDPICQFGLLAVKTLHVAVCPEPRLPAADRLSSNVAQSTLS